MRPTRSLVTLTLAMLLCALPAWAGMISLSQEIEIGRKGAAQLEQKYGVVRDANARSQVNQLGQSLAQFGHRGLTYHFSILNSKQINALAFPGGFVYVTSGLLKVMPIRQLAFVMGHEIGHVECKHSVRQLESKTYRQAGGAVLLTLFSRGRQTNRTAETALSAANTVVSNQYSQSAEKEADRMGMELMAKAGYNPMFAVEALQTLQKNGGQSMPGFMNSLLGSHPLTSDRIDMAREYAPTIPFAQTAPSPSPVSVP